MDTKGWREHTYYHFDPFAAEIEPALLNSVDMRKYVDKGCLIETDDFDESRLKTASYELRFLGKLYYWTSNCEGLEPRCREIKANDWVKLERNSITYLWTKEQLWLPEYIAARFNLHIRHVHRGILLGTGPLVDAGFGGSILIPLHNLTDRDYEIRGGEGIVWVEFTKLSKNKHWTRLGNDDRPNTLKEFPVGKVLHDANDYFDKAGVVAAGGVQSAFKGALNRAENEARQAKEEAEEAKSEARNIRKWNWLGIAIGVATIVVAVVVGSWAAFAVVEASVDRVQEANHRLMKEHVENLEERIRRVEGAGGSPGVDGTGSTGEPAPDAPSEPE